MIKQLQKVMHAKEKKYQDSFQVDYIIINLTTYLQFIEPLMNLLKKESSDPGHGYVL